MNKNILLNSRYHTTFGVCNSCRELILSERGGDCKYCSCGESFIDQERFTSAYARGGGEVTIIATLCPATCDQEGHKDNPKFAKIHL